MIDAYPLGDVTATQRAVLDGLVARLATADMAAGQKDDPRLEEEREREKKRHNKVLTTSPKHK